MNNFDYTQIKELFKKYLDKYSSEFSILQNDIAKELLLKVDSLEEISREIVDLVDELLPINQLLPNNNDEITIMGMTIKLQRADPNIPIGFDNASKAYSEGTTNDIYQNVENKKKEDKLERLAKEFYQTAFRIIKITEKLPGLKAFKSNGVRDVRNHLVEHPEGNASGITYNSFSYSKNEGPYIKGVRRNKELGHMDKGFKINNLEFISNFINNLEQVC
jgi:hypothetical protein